MGEDMAQVDTEDLEVEVEAEHLADALAAGCWRAGVEDVPERWAS